MTGGSDAVTFLSRLEAEHATLSNVVGPILSQLDTGHAVLLAESER
jgi:hypothetical protein